MYIDDALVLIQFLCFACERRFFAGTFLPPAGSPVPGFSALRVYALLDGKKLISGFIFLPNLVPLVTNLVSAFCSTRIRSLYTDSRRSIAT